MENIGSFIKEERIRQGLTLRDLSEKSNVRLATVYDVESEKSKGSFTVVCRILKGLGFDLQPVSLEDKQKI